MKNRRNDDKFETFIVITIMLNSKFQVTPILFGSLGLSRAIDKELEVNDIDVLVPDNLLTLTENWDVLQKDMKDMDYELTDNDEHEFTKDNTVVAFAKESVLMKDNEIDSSKLSVVAKNEIRYKVLTPEQFKTVYEFSKKDGYRRTKRGGADSDKIKMIGTYLYKQ